MASEPDGGGSADTLEVIRTLLQKLEEAASADGATAKGSAEPAGEPTSEPAGARQPGAVREPVVREEQRGGDLARLQRGQLTQAAPVAVASPVEIGPPSRPTDLVAARPMAPAVDMPLEPAPQPRKRRAYLMAGTSFLFGVACAVALSLSFEPLRQMVERLSGMGSQTASTPATPPAGTEVAANTSSTPPPAATYSSPSGTTETAPSAPDTPPADKPALAAPPSVDMATVAPLPSPEPAGPVAAPVPAASPPAASAPPAAQQSPSAASEPPRATAQATLPKVPPLSIASLIEGLPGKSAPFPLRLEPMPKPADAMLVVLRGFPDWLSLSRGSALGNGIWLIPAHAASDVQILATLGVEGSATVRVELATIDGRVVAQSETLINVRRPVAEPAVAAAQSSDNSTGLTSEAIVRLLARADLLLDTGELATARQLYRLAAEAGSAGGALKLAETYDPGELQRLGMLANAADELKARQWYELAQSLGSQQAAERLVQMRQR